jgi:hypothetical protein
MFPNGKVHGNPQPSLGQGRVVGEAGAIVYRGPVPPGEQLFVRFAYSMPYETSLLHLAAVSEVDIEEAAVALRWTDRVSPRGILGNPHRAVHGTQDEFRQSVFLLTEPVPAGEPILLTLANLPIQSKMPVWLTTAGGAGMIVFFLLAVIGVALRRRAQHAAS